MAERLGGALSGVSCGNSGVRDESLLRARSNRMLYVVIDCTAQYRIILH